MVAAYKKPARHPMPTREHEVLNEKMKKPHVISEHVNGILKNRIRILNKHPFVVKDKATMWETIKYIDACIILHNLLVGIQDDVPDDWLHEMERLSDINECEPLADDDELNQPVLEN